MRQLIISPLVIEFSIRYSLDKTFFENFHAKEANVKSQMLFHFAKMSGKSEVVHNYLNVKKLRKTVLDIYYK